MARKSILRGPVVPIPPIRIEDLALGGADVPGARTMCIDSDGREWTFQEVRETVERYARKLGSAGVGVGDYVPLLAAHSGQALAAALAIMRIGGVYVPLDMRWPAERVRKVIARAGARSVLADDGGAEHILSSLDATDPIEQVIILGDAAAEGWWRESVIELWDTVAAQADPYAAAGFSLGGRSSGASYHEAEEYARHVVSVCSPAIHENAKVVDLGAGSGLVGLRLARTVGHYTSVDPSDVSLARLRDDAHTLGCAVETICAFADELSQHHFRGADLVLLSSCVQFFPSLVYLWRVLEVVAEGIAPGATVVIADLIDTDLERPTGGQLGVTQAFCRSLVALGYSIEIRARHHLGWTGPLARRLDLILTRADGSSACARRICEMGGLQARTEIETLTATSAPAYCIFTSGSTGEPKGAIIPHSAAVNVLSWVNQEISVKPGDRMLSVAPFAFDLSIYDLFGIPAAGGTVVFVSNVASSDPDDLLDVVHRRDITLWNSAPATFTLMMTAASDVSAACAGLRHVLLSGDFVPLSTRGQMERLFPNAKLTVLGGATEATIWSSFFHVDRVNPSWSSIPYGTPIANTAYYILGANRRVMPVGEPGELYIGGDGVALGYVGDTKSTQAKFISDRWRGGAERMYATGDRVRVTPEGSSEILGRLDSQVKVNGYRIELSEVEGALGRHASVLACSAWVDTSGRLCAAYIPRGFDSQVATVELQQFMAGIIPAYMVPSRISAVKALPITNNGKIARTLLGTVKADDR